ncbi:MAG TPA: hypothetical protein VE033_09165 [Acetobacteraceae bacterium]|nr:hypothetical protein [Acetobacteraceae bacterium]
MEPFGEQWMTGSGTELLIRADEAGRAYLGAVATDVPGRAEGRRTWHRERYDILAYLKVLVRSEPSLFPAKLHRAEAPDFLLKPMNHQRSLAIEHSMFGQETNQHRLHLNAEEDARTTPEFRWIGGLTAKIGDTPERAWLSDLKTAIKRKADAKHWRNAPSADRCLLLHDQAELGFFVSDANGQAMLNILADEALPEYNLSSIVVIRSQTRVLATRRTPPEVAGEQA